MYPLVHSPTQQTTTLKSKWNTFKEWFTPDLTKRRPSQCSTTSTSTTLTASSSTCCCHNNNNKEEFIPSHKKRPSITTLNENVLDKCMSPFRRRPSNASHCSSIVNDIIEEESSIIQQQQNELYELYHFAMDEINYAEDSQGSPYYHGDKIAAKEAIDNCISTYQHLIDHHAIIDTTIEYKISTLKTKFDNLPQENDDDYEYY